MSDNPFIVIGSVSVWILGVGNILTNPSAIHRIGIETGLMHHPLFLSIFGTFLAVLLVLLAWSAVVVNAARLVSIYTERARIR